MSPLRSPLRPSKRRISVPKSNYLIYVFQCALYKKSFFFENPKHNEGIPSKHMVEFEAFSRIWPGKKAFRPRAVCLGPKLGKKESTVF